MNDPSLSPNESKILQLIEHLQSLHDGRRSMLQLLSFGNEAIPHLRAFLLEGTPGIVYQPRQWAAEALGTLGAKEALIDYLFWPRDISDPAIAYAEEAVEITAARELKQWETDDVFHAMLNLVAYHAQPGVIETLGEFRRPEALPYLVRALEDDVCRTAAEEALRKFGRGAAPTLLHTAVTAHPSRDEETPSSLRRRESALRILAEIGISSEQWRSLRPLLSESNPNIVAAAARLAAHVGSAKDHRWCVRRLTELRPNADWLLQTEIEECLSELDKAGADSR
jgi:HEAT repeat protein